MSDLATFVDVVIPIAIPNLLTYRVPLELEGEVVFGQRVIVQLGKAKLYTAIVHKVHTDPPKNYEAKYIDSLLDDLPIVTVKQMRFWEWMASYYLCTLGEVVGMALPASLKLASETKLVLNDYHEDLDVTVLSDKEFLVLEALEIQKTLEIKDVAEILGIKTVQPIIKKLIEKGFVTTAEELKERYRPKTEELVFLHDRLRSEDELQRAFEELERKAPKQSELLMAYLREDPDYSQGVQKIKLQKLVNVEASVTKKLIEKEVFRIEARYVDRIESYDGQRTEEKKLSPAQNTALEEIKTNFESKDVVLLHGVTGSGKTEVFVRLIKETIARGEQVLYLLPEIALTTQLIQRLQRYFGDQIGVYHSKFNQMERAETWNKTLNPEAQGYQIVMGARSSIFLPFRKLGLVIVDEEHETSYKQHDPAPRYHGRDSAVVLAMLHKAKVLMGSATPAVETYYNAEEGRYGLVELKHRFGDLIMPEIQCADVAKEMKKRTMKSHFTSFLLEAMEDTLKRNKQIILFQNRRGYAPLWQCKTCGWVPQCTRCDVSLTYHKREHHLNCHYCGYSVRPPLVCGACGSNDIRSIGFGTEKIEEDLALFLPKAKVARMDLDTTRSKHAYQKLLGDFDAGEIDILVGTQMVTKGLDFENVELVSVLNADALLNFPDFRAFEKAFQLMTQVAGRAGRRNERGRVIIQTYNPDHWVIQKVMQYDFASLYKQELTERFAYHYPPYYRLIKLNLRHKGEGFLHNAAKDLAKQLREHFGERVIGPEAPYVARINNYYHQNILMKIDRDYSPAKFKKIVKEVIMQFQTDKEMRSIRIIPDVDPM
ncbi:MAG: primosomal protein N' (replication factor Y) [Flavobacteriales bacterium]|jgi:primosomal protein N' (replication factor Y)